jgi:hypothetical protein
VHIYFSTYPLLGLNSEFLLVVKSQDVSVYSVFGAVFIIYSTELALDQPPSQSLAGYQQMSLPVYVGEYGMLPLTCGTLSCSCTAMCERSETVSPRCATCLGVVM